MRGSGVDLTLLKLGATYTRKELARAWGYESPAIQRGVFTPAGAGLIILFVTRERRSTDTPYVNYLTGDLLFWDGEAGHGSDTRMATTSTCNESIHVFYRELHASPFEYRGEAIVVDQRIRSDAPSSFVFRLLHDLSARDDVMRCEPELRELPATVREAVVLARLGQGRFRLELIETWGGRCAVTGVQFPPTLRASHIKPWRLSTNAERLNPANGLLLLPQYDALFDHGHISFEESGKVLMSPGLDGLPLDRLGIQEEDRLRFVPDEHRSFLEYHRSHVFKTGTDH